MTTHQHISPKNPNWDPLIYQCECYFKTGDRREFDNHLEINKEIKDLEKEKKKAIKKVASQKQI